MHAVWIILVCAGVTLLLRAAPFMFFGGRRGIPAIITRLGGMLPAAIMAALVIYCLKAVPYGAFADGAKQLAAAAVVVLMHLWRRSTLLSIAVGTAVYMLLIRL